MENKNLPSNLILGMESLNWDFWYPREAQKPFFAKENMSGETVLIADAKGNSQCYGAWVCLTEGIKGGETYRFAVDYKTQDVSDENTSVYVMLTWMAKGIMVTRDYVDNLERGDEGWSTLTRTIDAPENADSVKVELAFRWSENGRITWRRPSLTVSDPIWHRVVNAVTTYIVPRPSLAENLEAILNILDEAGKLNPDIICLSETVYDRGASLTLEEKCETVPGKLTDALSQKARQYNSYIIISMYEKEGDFLYNTGLLIDRKGEIAGKYRKMQLPLSEAEEGVMPGNDYPVFETDFGKIGILICWDQCYPELARILRIKGAEMLFVPTIGYSPIQSLARAVDNGIHVVVSGSDGPNPSQIIDPDGNILSEVKIGKDGVACAEIDLDKRFYSFWLSVGAANGEAKSVYMKERRMKTFSEITKTL